MKLFIQCIGIALLPFLFACKKDSLNKEEFIVGSWLPTMGCEVDADGNTFDCVTINIDQNICIGYPTDGDYFIFNEDGSYQHNFGNCNGRGEYTCTDAELGTWEVSGSRILVTLDQDYDCFSDEFQPVNESGTLEIVSCADNQLVLNESDQNGTVQLTLTKQ